MSFGLVIAAVVFLPALFGILLLGIAAYRGRWHSWHGNDSFFHWPYTPLASAWFAASVLLIVLTFAVAAVVPGAVVAVLAALAIILLLVSIVVYRASPQVDAAPIRPVAGRRRRVHRASGLSRHVQGFTAESGHAHAHTRFTTGLMHRSRTDEVNHGSRSFSR